jgi:hypothetical protein
MKHILFLINTNLLYQYGAAVPILNGVQFDRNIPLEVLSASLFLLILSLSLVPSHHMHYINKQVTVLTVNHLHST